MSPIEKNKFEIFVTTFVREDTMQNQTEISFKTTEEFVTMEDTKKEKGELLSQPRELILEVDGLDEYNRVVQFLNEKGQSNYDRNLLKTLELLSQNGLNFKQLLNVNFNTNIDWRFTNASSKFLQDYANCLERIKNTRPEETVMQLVLKNSEEAILHEIFYSKLYRKPGWIPRIEDIFVVGVLVEVLAEEFCKCPKCNKKMAGEHLRYRGDLVCLNCDDVDIDVKASFGGAMKHCTSFLQSEVKTQLTRYSIYLQPHSRKKYFFRLKDCADDEMEDLILLKNSSGVWGWEKYNPDSIETKEPVINLTDYNSLLTIVQELATELTKDRDCSSRLTRDESTERYNRNSPSPIAEGLILKRFQLEKESEHKAMYLEECYTKTTRKKKKKKQGALLIGLGEEEDAIIHQPIP